MYLWSFLLFLCSVILDGSPFSMSVLLFADKFVQDHIVIQDLQTDPLEITYLCYEDIKEFVEKITATLDKVSNFPGNSERKWRYPKGHAQQYQYITGWKGMYMYFVAEKSGSHEALDSR